MKELLLAVTGFALVNSVVLSQSLGFCPSPDVSKKVEILVGMSAAVIFAIAIASVVANLAYIGALVNLYLKYLQTIVLILIITALVQFVEMFLGESIPLLYEVLNVYLPLIITSCAVLGVAFINVMKSHNSMQSVVSGIGISAGLITAITMLAGVRRRIKHNDVPYSFQGSLIALIASGSMAIVFFGFSGLI